MGVVENARNGIDLDCRAAVADICGAEDDKMLDVWRGDALTARSSDRRAANVNEDIVKHSTGRIEGQEMWCWSGLQEDVDNISELSKVDFVIFDQLLSLIHI